MKVYLLFSYNMAVEAYFDKHKADQKKKELTKRDVKNGLTPWWYVEEVEIKDAESLP